MIKIALNYYTLGRIGETPATPEELEKWLGEDCRAVIESDILSEEYGTVAEAEAIAKTLPCAALYKYSDMLCIISACVEDFCEPAEPDFSKFVSEFFPGFNGFDRCKKTPYKLIDGFELHKRRK